MVFHKTDSDHNIDKFIELLQSLIPTFFTTLEVGIGGSIVTKGWKN